ncbi:MAG: PASTA domain-containing protein [Bacteroidaceae bacterium]|nr:PASTA domain-containing protein [Bacteroidaceae bacterium]
MTKDKKHSIGWLLLNILIMVAVSIILIVITFRWMQSYTRHGQYITVPDVSGMYEEEAGQALAAAGLRYEVSDYKFDKSMVEGGVIEQNPKAGAYVKQERKIYLTLNSGKEPVKAVPDLADNSSLRAAESQLRAAGFKLSPTVYVDGDLDWVYEIHYKGAVIEAGTEIPEGSVLTIVAGNGNPVEIIEEVDSTTIVDSDFFE